MTGPKTKGSAMARHYTPNDQRSIAMNPNNPAHAAAAANHIRQLATNPPTAPASAGAVKPEEPKK